MLQFSTGDYRRSVARACALPLLLVAALIAPSAGAWTADRSAPVDRSESGERGALVGHAAPTRAVSRWAVEASGAPIPIVQNAGQWPAYVDFAVGAFGGGPWLIDDGILLAAPAGENDTTAEWNAKIVRIDRIDSQATWEPRGRIAVPRISYLVGDDLQRHQSAVPLWREVSHRLLDGHRIVVSGGVELGWSWRVVDDGARYASVAERMAMLSPALQGGWPIEDFNAHDDTVIGELIEPVDVVHPRGAIALAHAAYPREAIGREKVGAAFDTAGLTWATYFGGSGDEKLYTLDVDLAGSIYVSGSSTSPDLPVTPGAFDRTQRGDRSAYVAKLSPDGARMEYLTFLGGRGTDYVKVIAVNHESGNLIAGGDTTSTDFPTTADADRRSAAGGWDAFLVALDPTGPALRYSSCLGSDGLGESRPPRCIVSDPKGDPHGPHATSELHGG